MLTIEIWVTILMVVIWRYLKDGEVFSTLYKTVSDPLLIGGASLSSKEVYSTLPGIAEC